MTNPEKSFSRREFLITVSAAFFTIISPSFFYHGTSPRLMTQESIRITASPEENINKEVSIILAGDTMLGRTVQIKSRELNNFNYPFEKVAGTLKEANLVFINLENSINEECPSVSEGYLLCAKPEAAKGLAFAGIDIVNLANNHTGAFGKKGIDATRDALRKEGIEATGIGGLLVKEVKKTKFGFLGFDFTSKLPGVGDYELITFSKSEVDILIVGVHWGTEYMSEPNKDQKIWAVKMVEAGADVIVGHHPHWVQTVEFINGKPVYYSLGNFVFDQMWSEETKKGMVVRLTFKDAKLVKEERLPIYMSSWAQPEFVE